MYSDKNIVNLLTSHLIAKGIKQKAETGASLYAEYRTAEYEDVEITLIPYYAWANRGEGEMEVWVNQL